MLTRVTALAVLVLFTSITAFGVVNGQVSYEKAVSVKTKYQWQLLSMPGVVGCGVGHDGLVWNLRLYVLNSSVQVPHSLDGVSVERIVSGPVSAFVS
jgi:hypothetical protein